MRRQSQRFDRNDRSERSSSRRSEYPSSQDYYSDMRDYSVNGRDQRDFSGSTYGSYGREEESYRGDRSERWDRSERPGRPERLGRSDEYSSDRYASPDRYSSERIERPDRSERFMTDSDRYSQRYGGLQGSETFSSSGRDIEGGGYGSSSSRSLSSIRGRFEGRGPKGFKRSDDRIKEEVCEFLTRDPSIDASEIDVEVKEGEVTLTGTVPDRRMKHLAEECVEHCFGVREVNNQIRVKREALSSSATSSNPSSGSRRSSSTSSLS